MRGFEPILPPEKNRNRLYLQRSRCKHSASTPLSLKDKTSRLLRETCDMSAQEASRRHHGCPFSLFFVEISPLTDEGGDPPGNADRTSRLLKTNPPAKH